MDSPISEAELMHLDKEDMLLVEAAIKVSLRVGSIVNIPIPHEAKLRNLLERITKTLNEPIKDEPCS